MRKQRCRAQTWRATSRQWWPDALDHSSTQKKTSDPRSTSNQQNFAVAFGANSSDFSVWELAGLRLEQHFRATEAFGANSDGKSNSVSKCPVSPTNALFFNFFMRSEVLMMKLPVEDTKMSISDMRRSQWPPPGHLQSTPAGRRRGHFRQRTHEHQN